MSIVTQAMVERYLVCHRLELNESNVDGARKALEACERGEGQLDARLCDSPETREVFAPLRAAYFAALKQEQPAYSNVSFFDSLPPTPTVDGEALHSEPLAVASAAQTATQEAEVANTTQENV